jgi:hypothetical protein
MMMIVKYWRLVNQKWNSRNCEGNPPLYRTKSMEMLEFSTGISVYFWEKQGSSGQCQA